MAGQLTVPRAQLSTSTAAVRGERLFPPRGSRVYWPLTALRLAYAEAISKYVATRSPGRLLDVGCGNMPYRPLFADIVSDYVGCDLAGNELASVLIEDGRIDAGDESFDIVLSSQVLEHVDSPQEYLDEARRVLAPDGLLILSTHGVWRYHPDPRDLWRWTSAGLRVTVESAGFEILSFQGVLGPAATAIQHWQDAVLRSVPRMMRRPFTFIVQQLLRWTDGRCNPAVRDRDAGTYLLVAVRRG